MSVNFPLTRLPSVAFDNVIQVMEPIEQFIMCQVSRKLKVEVKRLLKNYTLNIEYYDFSERIYFGHTPRKESIIDSVHEWNSHNDEKYGKVFLKHNGKAFTYRSGHVLPFDRIFKLLADVFEPQSFVCRYPRYHCSEGNYAYDFHLIENKDSVTFETRSNCRKASEKIWRNLPANGTTLYSIKIKNADWMALDDILLTFGHVNLFDMKVTNLAVNEFLMKWLRSEEDIVPWMTMKVHVDFRSQLSIEAIVDGLGAVRVPVETGCTTAVIYQFQRRDGRKAQLKMKGHTIWFCRA